MIEQEGQIIEVSWGGRAAVGQLRRTARRVLRIEVQPLGKLVVFAPFDAEDAEISERLSRKAAWIFRELDRVLSLPAITPERRFVSGETHLFLGSQYRLALEQGKEGHVRISGSRLILTVRNVDDQAQCRRLLMAFYAIAARRVFHERLESVSAPFLRKGLKRPSLVIRRMTKRWGSYTPKGRIVLNVDLVRASPAQIDYVICHELMHAFHPDHGKEWRDMLSNFMPDWEFRKLMLERQLR
ncbi:MAG: SprT family zinc-dependent metalloprotease [Microcystis sp. LE19-4.1E]|jgi:predicted metal-dependent hydrolase|nr:SprT family zinc-dependent metalloprotease [Microcystis sp. LE19-4.1E]